MSRDGCDVHLAVDVGGTFTDLVCRRAGEIVGVLKVASTPANPALGVAEAIRRAVELWAIAPGDIERFVHGTTVATNAVLERRGARLGLLTTTGFRDVLEIGRQKRSRMYDLTLEPETPGFLAPGARRKEIGGRIAADGAEIEPLDEAAVAAAAEALVQCDHNDLRFLGSPTVQVNGLDIDPAAHAREDFGYSCRHYGRTQSRRQGRGLWTTSWLRARRRRPPRCRRPAAPAAPPSRE